MTFTEALTSAGYYFQPECGCYLKYDSNDNVLTTKVFSL